MSKEEYKEHLTPWVPNHLVADGDDTHGADFLYGAAYTQMCAGDLENASLTNILMGSALLTNFYLTLFISNSTKEETE